MKRRSFLKKSSGLLGLSLAGGFPSISAAGRKLPAAERIRVAVIGVNGRGNNLLRTFASMKDVEIAGICDVDSRVLNRRISETKKDGRHNPAGLRSDDVESTAGHPGGFDDGRRHGGRGSRHERKSAEEPPRPS